MDIDLRSRGERAGSIRGLAGVELAQHCGLADMLRERILSE